MTYELMHNTVQSDIDISDVVDRTIRVGVSGLSDSFLRVSLIFIIGFIMGQLILACIFMYWYRVQNETKEKHVIIKVCGDGKVVDIATVDQNGNIEISNDEKVKDNNNSGVVSQA